MKVMVQNRLKVVASTAKWRFLFLFFPNPTYKWSESLKKQENFRKYYKKWPVWMILTRSPCWLNILFLIVFVFSWKNAKVYKAILLWKLFWKYADIERNAFDWRLLDVIIWNSGVLEILENCDFGEKIGIWKDKATSCLGHLFGTFFIEKTKLWASSHIVVGGVKILSKSMILWSADRFWVWKSKNRNYLNCNRNHQFRISFKIIIFGVRLLAYPSLEFYKNVHR